jgi:serine/threonine protein kinase
MLSPGLLHHGDPLFQIRFYAAEIVSALGYLHRRGVIYRDLKLENLLLDRNGHIKMVDFGLCKDEIFGNKLTGTFCGTPSYLPPEVLRSSQYGRAVDWWGLGIVIFEMLTGQLPFYNEERKVGRSKGNSIPALLPQVMFRLIVTEKVRYPRAVEGEARELLQQLLVKNPDRRLGRFSSRHILVYPQPGGGIGDAEDIMQHAFFATIDWTELEKKRITPPFKPEVSLVRTRKIIPTYPPEPAQRQAGHALRGPRVRGRVLTADAPRLPRLPHPRPGRGTLLLRVLLPASRLPSQPPQPPLRLIPLSRDRSLKYTLVLFHFCTS